MVQKKDIRRAVFLDRDGTLIEDLHYPREAEKVRLIPGVVEALKTIRSKGYLLFVVSNQSGVGRGLISDQEFREVHNRTCQLLEEHGVTIDEYAYCFHHPEDECQCRKPRTGLIPKEHGDQTLDLRNSFMVGDRKSDLELGKNFGGKSFLVLTGNGKDTKKELSEPHEYEVCESLTQVASQLP